jgi:hypothetical protein
VGEAVGPGHFPPARRAVLAPVVGPRHGVGVARRGYGESVAVEVPVELVDGGANGGDITDERGGRGFGEYGLAGRGLQEDAVGRSREEGVRACRTWAWKGVTGRCWR